MDNYKLSIIFVNPIGNVAANSFTSFICVIYLGYNDMEKYIAEI